MGPFHDTLIRITRSEGKYLFSVCRISSRQRGACLFRPGIVIQVSRNSCAAQRGPHASFSYMGLRTRRAVVRTYVPEKASKTGLWESREVPPEGPVNLCVAF